jgi:hypothetical protein
MNEMIQRRGKKYDEVVKLNRKKVTVIIALGRLVILLFRQKQWYAQRVRDIQAAGRDPQYERDLQSQP